MRVGEDMREILFRGKRLDNGEWVYGNLAIRIDGETTIYDRPSGNGLVCSVGRCVIPESVGQYTGLCENGKSGKKIFEGDIVEGHCHSQWSHRLQRCVVEYDRDGFEARHYVKQGEIMRYYSYKVLFSKDVVVIGNIHDNPELLKGADDERKAD
jgi:uncharacterized phage protein (TIGR01671 family)